MSMINPANRAFKNSHSPWLGQIPTDWGLKRLKFLVSCIGGGTPATGNPDFWNGEVPWVSPKDMKFSAITETEDYLTEAGVQSSATTVIESNAVLVVVRSGILRHSIPTARNSVPVALNQDMKALISYNQLRAAYLYWIIEGNQKQLLPLWSKAGCTVESIEMDSMLNTEMPLPSLDEQDDISRFLDFKTAQIDALIAKKRALLDKLAEKRTALISHAVTKGLDPAVAMKDSGVAWLGEIPIDWTTKRLRFLTTMSGGMTPSTGNSKYWGGEVPWITPKDMKSETLARSIDTLTDEALQETGITLHESGRVLIVVRGMILTHTFPVAINKVPSTVNQDMKALSTSLNHEYFALLLRGIQSLVLSIVEESAHGTKVLRTDIFKNIFLPAPPPRVQKEIVEQVSILTAKLNAQQQRIESAIERLQEYRSALITNAVTGKIDVRGFEIPVSADAQEPAHA